MSRYTSLEVSKVAAAFAVVVLHAAAGVILGAEFGSYSWWAGNIIDSAVRWCVPVFVLVSGALLLTPKTAQMPLKDFYTRRSRRILIPLAVWTIVFLCWPIVKNLVENGQVEFPSVSVVIQKLVAGRPYYHLWYLYMVLGLYLFAPFVAKLLAQLDDRQAGILVTVLFGLAGIQTVSYTLSGVTWPSVFAFWFLQYLPYFIAGALLFHRSWNCALTILWMILTASILVTILGTFVLSAAQNGENQLYFYDYLSVTVVPMSLALFALLVRTFEARAEPRIITVLSPASFGIYLVHPIVLEVLGFVARRAGAFEGALYIAGLSFVTFAVSAVFAWTVIRLPGLRQIC